MNKAPLNKFERQSGRHPITGVLACESKLREQSYLKFGCNGYERRRPLSQPLAFWREEDILRYLRTVSYTHLDVYKRQAWCTGPAHGGGCAENLPRPPRGPG